MMEALGEQWRVEKDPTKTVRTHKFGVRYKGEEFTHDGHARYVGVCHVQGQGCPGLIVFKVGRPAYVCGTASCKAQWHGLHRGKGPRITSQPASTPPPPQASRMIEQSPNAWSCLTAGLWWAAQGCLQVPLQREDPPVPRPSRPMSSALPPAEQLTAIRRRWRMRPLRARSLPQHHLLSSSSFQPCSPKRHRQALPYSRCRDQQLPRSRRRSSPLSILNPRASPR